MTSYREEYQRKLISAEEAAGLVKSGMWIDYGAICGFPSLIDKKLAERAHELKEVKIRAEHSHTQIPGVDLSRFDLNSYYSEEQIQELSKELKAERLKWLSQFRHLNRDIISALNP